MFPVPILVAFSRVEGPCDSKGTIELCPLGTLDLCLGPADEKDHHLGGSW